jgi:GT2 family glycosyltransferase
MSERPDVTVTVVSWNTRELLRACLQSLSDGVSRSRVEVHLVDNASSDGSIEMVLADFQEVRVFPNSQNLGFARANNQSWREAEGRYWMLLNPDTEVRPGAIDALVSFMDSHPQAGLATARLVNLDGTPQYCAQPTPTIGRTLLEASRLHRFLPASTRGSTLLSTYWTYDKPMKIGWTWGTALIARREAVETVGPLCDDFFMYGEDLEWCLRMADHGWEIWFCPEAEVLHHGGQSSAQQWSESSRACKVWDGFYQALARRRSRIYVRALRAATLGALGAEWIALTVKGQKRPQALVNSVRYHLQSLGVPGFTTGERVEPAAHSRVN